MTSSSATSSTSRAARRFPADGELVEAVSLKINESTLTGEPEVDKTVDEAHFDPEATYPSNVVLRGTTVADGYGILVVTAVGDHTEAGRVTEQSTVQTDEPTPLDRQLTRLSQLIGRVGIAPLGTDLLRDARKGHLRGRPA